MNDQKLCAVKAAEATHTCHYSGFQRRMFEKSPVMTVSTDSLYRIKVNSLLTILSVLSFGK